MNWTLSSTEHTSELIRIENHVVVSAAGEQVRIRLVQRQSPDLRSRSARARARAGGLPRAGED